MWLRAADILICGLGLIIQLINGFRHHQVHITSARCIDCDWRVNPRQQVGLFARRPSGDRSPEVEVDADPPSDALRETSWSPTAAAGPLDAALLPPPLNSIVDVNLERRSVVYEVQLGRDLGFDIVQLDLDSAGVGYVQSDGKAAQLGISTGDTIVATSATAGALMWTHHTADSIKSALSTRFVMSATVKMRLERKLDRVDPSLIPHLRVPFYTTVKLKRPIGLHVVEGPDKAVYVQYIKPDQGAARCRRMEVGDQIVEMSASWGDRMWEVNSVESFVVGVRMRSEAQLTFRLKRLVPLNIYSNQLHSDRGKEQPNASTSYAATSSTNNYSLSEQLERIQTARELKLLWKTLKGSLKTQQNMSSVEVGLNTYIVNKMMSLGLKLELPEVSVDLFETVFGFQCEEQLLSLLDPGAEDASEVSWDDVRSTAGGPLLDDGDVFNSTAMSSVTASAPRRVFLTPNNFVCTTAVKAYGRLKAFNKALALLPWMEQEHGQPADIFFMSALLYICAKSKRLNEAEKIFWVDIPARQLIYTVATMNSLMFLYAKLNKDEEVLQVHQLMKKVGLRGTVVTNGVLIKALMRSGKEELSFDLLKRMPEYGITPGVEVYNQILEHYARNQNFKGAKKVLRLMTHAKPPVKLNVVTYGYLIDCFALSKKPRSALATFDQMRKENIAPNGFAYMGVLKALSHLRDGFSSSQVLREMYEVGVIPDRRHFAMAMFTAVMANQCTLAESFISLFLRQGGKLDTALCTLWLRALLQQNKWVEGSELIRKMESGKEFARPNQQTYNCLLQYQITADRWTEALQTLQVVLNLYSQALSRSGMVGSLQDTFRSLSFALKKYSSAVEKRHKEDVAIMGAGAIAGSPPKPYPGSPPSDMSTNDSNDEVVDNTDFVAATIGGELFLEGQLTSPSAESLKFAVSALELIGTCDNIFIMGNFYAELLKALILEGQVELAKRLLDMKRHSQVRLRASEDNEKMHAIEQLVERAIKSGLITSKK